MLKVISRIKNIFEWVVFIVLLLTSFILISPVLPIKGVPKFYVVMSGSMEPAIKTGALAMVHVIPTENIKAGDVIAFASPSDPKETILHRVVEIKQKSPLLLQTKGDNNNTNDMWQVTQGGVLGVYVFSVPVLGYLGIFVRRPYGFVLLLIVPALIFIIFQAFGIKSAIKEEVEKRVKAQLAKESKKGKENNEENIL